MLDPIEIGFWGCSLAALYPYAGYPAILWLAGSLADPNERPADKLEPLATDEPFTMIVPAHNEEANVPEKIRLTIPLLANRESRLLIVSDYSTDSTLAVASASAHPQVLVVENAGGRGRALATNFAVAFAQTEVLVFSDVETRVPASTVQRMLAALGCSDVGCVNPRISLSHRPEDEVSQAAGIYFRFENWLRVAETKLGLFAISSGQCMAVRRKLFMALPPTGDVDFTTPIDVVDQGYRCVHLADSLAFDTMPPGPEAEFKSRARMVAKNFSGTISRWGWRNLLWHPLYSWALYSHKILRWLVPFFLGGAFLCNMALVRESGLYQIAMTIQILFFLSALAGWISRRARKNLPMVGRIFAFVLANSAFAVGVIRAMSRNVPSYYVPTGQLGKR
jgi:cellulose synthase/poly-beta-1,6-N-acetylglucosamine synthase-like glycosyltransferase